MSFKVVQTRESGKNLLTIVPHLWEKDGYVKWPKGGHQIPLKDFKAMTIDCNSAPCAEWATVKCRLKRSNLKYEEAVAETKSMSDESDTDGFSDSMPPPKLPIKRKVIGREIIGRTIADDFSGIVR